MSLLVLCNPTAAGGRAAGRLPEVEAELRGLGAEFETVQTLGTGHVAELAGAAGAAGRTVVAVGGDGLMRTVAGALRNTEGRLAVVPAGRGNDFARVLEIPSDPAAAARVAVEGTIRTIDMGEIDGQPFLGIASVGVDSDTNRFANESKFRGNFVYLYAALRALSSWHPAHFWIKVDGGAHDVVGYSVVVANTSTYGGGMKMAPDADLEDGRLDVLTVAHIPRLRLMAKLPKLFRGTHTGLRFIDTWTAQDVAIEADRPFRVYADGDPIANLPARVTVRPRCLRVVVPA